MKRNLRHDRILERLAGEGTVSVESLAEDFGVNAVTIRRDLTVLEAEGLLERTRGGAVASHGGRVQFAFQQKALAHAAEKRAIARELAGRIQGGMCVSLDTGTTTLEVARNLSPAAGLKVLTTSLAIAAALYPHEQLELVLLGGTVRKGSPDLSGMLTEENLRRFRVDLAVLGADALRPEGLFTTDTEIARVSQSMLVAAERAVVVADSSKFADSAFVRFADWYHVHEVVTDAGIPDEARGWLAEKEVELTVVPAAEPAPERSNA